MLTANRLFFFAILGSIAIVVFDVRPAAADASLILTPRLEAIQGKDGALANRGLLRGKFTGSRGPYSVYLEAFGEGEAVVEERERRRIENGVFLQEAYLEFKLDGFFLRAGKQAMRWSDMWVLPSLDIWTARRWNRFLFDPQAEQLEHSGGVSASYAIEGFSLDVAVVSEMARSRYPEPLPEFLDEKSAVGSGGGRVKFDVGGFSFSGVGARAGKRDVMGVAANYAFESFVPKIEIGHIKDHSLVPIGPENDVFFALGADVFLGSWTFQPQVTTYDFGDLNSNSRDYQALWYLSGTWQRDRHDFQFQTFGNTSSEDFFLNVFYGYNWKDWLQTAVFVQSYEGKDGGLFTQYKNATGGTVVGVRLEFNAGLGD